MIHFPIEPMFSPTRAHARAWYLDAPPAKLRAIVCSSTTSPARVLLIFAVGSEFQLLYSHLLQILQSLSTLIMGTLTADCPRLDAHCPHKLATSCRLTSTLNCCACADERVHSRTYRVYIDGVGFVNRGTRWQGYCWFCKGTLLRQYIPVTGPWTDHD
jgi:hypothetical protein